MGEYLVPANRSFTWESSPQEQGLLASAMGRSDLKQLLNTGQWGPLAGQPYQYQGGRTTIGYGGGGGYPGGYPGGGFPPRQTGDYPPWQGQPPWQPPIPPRVPPTIGDPFDPTPPDRTRPTTPFDVDPNKWTAPTAGGFVYDPNSVIPEFDQWSMWENQRIRDQNARIQRFQDPTSDINLNFAFEDAKRRGALPTTPLQDKAAFMAMTDANRGRQASVMPDDFGSGNPFADAQRVERQRSAAIQAEQERARMGFGVTPFTPIRGLGQEDTTPTFDQLAGRQERMRLEAMSRERAGQPLTPQERGSGFWLQSRPQGRIESELGRQAAADRILQQQAAANAQRVAEANRVQAQRASAERQRQAVTQSQQREESRGRAEQERKAVVSQKAAQRRKAVEAKSRARATAPKPAPNRQAPVRLATPTRIKPTTAGRQTGAAQRAAAKARQVAQQKAGAAKAAKSRSQAAARARNIAQERKDKKRGRRGPGKGDR